LITVPLLRELLAANVPVLSLEVVRTLAARNAEDARAVLAELAASESQTTAIRADAIAGLATFTKPDQQALLVKLAANENQTLRDEARRALRFSETDKFFSAPQTLPPFSDTEAWLKRIDAAPGKPDADAGRRIFFGSKVGLCSNCHRHTGRGNVVGPDLSLIAQQGDRAAILRSILEPNRDVAPQFFPTLLKLKDGSDFTGILLRSSSTEVFRDLMGKERTFQKADIIKRTELTTSPMPMGLVTMLTDGELRDLLAFLTSQSK
jgi:hypothetical protein